MVPSPGLVRGLLFGPRQAGRGTRRPPVPSGTGGRPRRRRLVAGVVVLFAAMIGGLAVPARPAYAHAELVATTPANGARLDTPPAAVTLVFSERVNLVRDGVRLLDGTGAVRSTEPARIDPTGPARVLLPVPAGLGPGSYTVAWRVVSADSHPIFGAFVFGVGDVPIGQLPSVAARTDADAPLSAVFWLFRWLGYAALALLSGGAIFLLLCWPAGWSRPRARRLLAIGWAGSLTCSVAVLLLQGPYAAGGSLARTADPDLLLATLGTDYGGYLLARLALLLVAGALLLRLARRAGKPTTAGLAGPAAEPATAPRLLPLAGVPGRFAVGLPLVVLGIALPATWVGTGHANAEPSAWAAAADTAHLAAMATWIGGLAFLAGCV